MKIMIRYWLPDVDTGWPGNVHIEGKKWKWRELGSEEELAKRKEALQLAKRKEENLHWQVKYEEEPKKPTPLEFLSAVGERVDGWRLYTSTYHEESIVFGPRLDKRFYKPIKDELEEG